MSRPLNVAGAHIDSHELHMTSSDRLESDHTGRNARDPSRNSETDERIEAVLGQDIVDRPNFDGGTTQGLGLSGIPQSSDAHPSLSRRNITYTNLTPDLSHAQSRDQDEGTRHSRQQTPETERRRWLTPDSSRNSLGEREVHYEDISDQVHLINRDAMQVTEGCCPTHGELLKEKVSWLSIVFIALAVFSWIGSGAFFGIAIAKPHWGHRIGPGKSMSYGNATFLCVLFSKLVEITFACSYVAALGQFLSRKAFPKNGHQQGGRGISLAEINLRLWILQPGTLITHWEGAKYVITTFLGIVTLAAAIAAMFYTSSVEALVSPKLKFTRNETRPIFGQVMTSFANNDYLGRTCQTSIPANVDPVHGGSTCLQISFAGNGFHNFETWQSAWRARQISSTFGQDRPLPIAALYENTTVHGQWITPSGENITTDSAKHGRLVLNVTMAMPNANVFRAAREPTNRILQPEELGGAGQYYVRAAAPVPAVNVLCVGASQSELQPMVGNETSPPSLWQVLKTPFDPLFGWSNNPDQITTSYHPWFGKLPIIFNSVGNTTSPYGLRHIYFLAKPPPETKTADYMLCGIRVFQYSGCSTHLFVAQAGNDLSVYCDQHPMKWRSYAETATATNPISLAVEEKTWTVFGAEWIRSLALTHGISDGNASSARLLTQMIPPYSNNTPAKLPLDTPTVAEALCILSSHTLLLSSDSAPFRLDWNYSNTNKMLQTPALQSFEGMISFRDYVSGGTANWESIFYVILAIVFILNCVCVTLLIMYYCKYGEITDYTEPQNLFALAINSPPSQTLAGACGCGPSGKMLGQRWCVDMQTTSENKSANSKRDSGAHFYVRYPEEVPLAVTTSAQNTPDPTAYPRMNRFSRFLSNSSPWNDSPILMNSKRRTKTTTTELGTFEMDDFGAVAQYMKLIGRE